MSEINVMPDGRRWIPRPETQEDWLAGRGDYVGASELAAIMNVSPYRDDTAYSVWLRKTGRVAPGTQDNLRLFMGRELEGPIGRWYQRETGRVVKTDNKIWVHPTLDFFAVNLDRLVEPTEEDKADGLTEDGVLELKTVGLLAKNKWDPYPAPYYLQIQGQLLATGRQWAELAVLVGGNADFMTFRILPDKNIHALIEKAVVEFWEYVKNDVEPPMKAFDLSNVMANADSSVSATIPIVLDHQILVRLKREIKALESQQEEVEDRVKEFMGKHERLSHLGLELVNFKNYPGRKMIDTKRLEKENPTIYKSFLTSTKSYRKFSVKEYDLNVEQPVESPSGATVAGSEHEHGGSPASAVGSETADSVSRQTE